MITVLSVIIRMSYHYHCRTARYHHIYNDDDEAKNDDLRHPTLLVLGRPLEDEGSLGGGPDQSYHHCHHHHNYHHSSRHHKWGWLCDAGPRGTHAIIVHISIIICISICISTTPILPVHVTQDLDGLMLLQSSSLSWMVVMFSFCNDICTKWYDTDIFNRSSRLWRWIHSTKLKLGACFDTVAWLGMREHVKSWCCCRHNSTSMREKTHVRAALRNAHFTLLLHPYHVLVHTVLLLEPDCLALWGNGASVLGGGPAPSGVAVRRLHQGGVRHPVEITPTRLWKEYFVSLLQGQIIFIGKPVHQGGSDITNYVHQTLKRLLR